MYFGVQGFCPQEMSHLDPLYTLDLELVLGLDGCQITLLLFVPKELTRVNITPCNDLLFAFCIGGGGVFLPSPLYHFKVQENSIRCAHFRAN